MHLSEASVIYLLFDYKQVILPLGLQREVDAHLKAYLSQKSMRVGSFSDNSLSRSSSAGSVATDEGLYEQQEPLKQISVAMEKILRQRSLQLRNKQQEWQVCRLTNFLDYLPLAVVILQPFLAVVILNLSSLSLSQYFLKDFVACAFALYWSFFFIRDVALSQLNLGLPWFIFILENIFVFIFKKYFVYFS